MEPGPAATLGRNKLTSCTAMRAEIVRKVVSPASRGRVNDDGHDSILEKLCTLPTERKAKIWERCSNDSLKLPRIELLRTVKGGFRPRCAAKRSRGCSVSLFALTATL